MKNWLETHLFMTRKELRGLAFLTILLLLLWSAPWVYRRFIFRAEPADMRAYEKEIRAFLASEQPSEAEQQSVRQAAVFKGVPFDPNTLNAALGEQLGLSERQVRMIQNYVAKGGRFRKKEDLAKIYSITEADFQRLAPFISLADTPRVSSWRSGNQSTKPAPGKGLMIELNSTDSLELQELRGIGPVFASRIVRFRDMLGGFYDKSQLLDVYGMEAERFQQIEKHIYVDTSKVAKIDINKADYATLSKHPWISARQARLIINYRQQHGSYRKADDLLGIEIINDEFLRKIVPYLKFSND